MMVMMMMMMYRDAPVMIATLPANVIAAGAATTLTSSTAADIFV